MCHSGPQHHHKVCQRWRRQVETASLRALGQDRLSGSATKGSVAGSILQFRQKPLSPALRLGLQPAEQRHQRVVEKDLHPAGVGIDRVSSERLGGDHADTSEGGLEAPLMGAQ